MRFFLLKKKKFQSSAALKLIFCWVDFRMNGVLLGFSRAVGGSTMQFIALSHTSCFSGGLWTISSSRRIKLSRACLLSDVLLNYIPPKCPRKRKKKKQAIILQVSTICVESWNMFELLGIVLFYSPCMEKLMLDCCIFLKPWTLLMTQMSLVLCRIEMDFTMGFLLLWGGIYFFN